MRMGARGARGGSSRQMADGMLGHMCASRRAWQRARGMRARWLGLVSVHHSARVRASEWPTRAAAAWPASGCAASLVRCGAMGLEGGFFVGFLCHTITLTPGSPLIPRVASRSSCGRHQTLLTRCHRAPRRHYYVPHTPLDHCSTSRSWRTATDHRKLRQFHTDFDRCESTLKFTFQVLCRAQWQHHPNIRCIMHHAGTLKV